MTARDLSFEAAPGPRIYRAYHVASDGDFHEATVLNVFTDEEAKAAAGTLENAFGIHLWERARFLGEFPPRTTPAKGLRT